MHLENMNLAPLKIGERLVEDWRNDHYQPVLEPSYRRWCMDSNLVYWPTKYQRTLHVNLLVVVTMLTIRVPLLYVRFHQGSFSLQRIFQ